MIPQNQTRITYLDCLICNQMEPSIELMAPKTIFGYALFGVGLIVLCITERALFALSFKKQRSLELLAYGVYTSKIKGRNGWIMLVLLSYVILVGIYELIYFDIAATDLTLNAGSCEPLPSTMISGSYNYTGQLLYVWFASTNPTAPNRAGPNSEFSVLIRFVAAVMPYLAILPITWNLVSSQYSPLHIGEIMKEGVHESLKFIRYKVDDKDLDQELIIYWKEKQQYSGCGRIGRFLCLSAYSQNQPKLMSEVLQRLNTKNKLVPLNYDWIFTDIC